MASSTDVAREEFREIYGDLKEMVIVRAPGRVNLIGEHTDYNGGFVLPIAIDRDIAIACRPNGRRYVRLYSIDFSEEAKFDLDDIAFNEDQRWINYPQGVAAILRSSSDPGHRLEGFEGVVKGTVPIGAGLSSSAAFEVASALAFCHISNITIERAKLARLCQRAENEFVGVNCGIMDQYVSLHAERGKAVLIDCQSLEHDLVPIDTSRAKVVVCDTGVKHELASSEYNVRRAECERAVDILAWSVPNIRALRDVSIDQFEAHHTQLPPHIQKRARHVIGENQRVLDSIDALNAGDLTEFGELMNASHQSLRDDYEVSCRELDIMVEAAQELTGVYGARMTGGGFGGCTVNLVDNDYLEDFGTAIVEKYEAATDVHPEVHVCEVEAGAGVVDGG